MHGYNACPQYTLFDMLDQVPARVRIAEDIDRLGTTKYAGTLAKKNDRMGTGEGKLTRTRITALYLPQIWERGSFAD